MFEKLGKKAIVAPVGIGIVLCCILSLAVSPMLRANPQNVPFAIVNLDKGAITIAGDSNIGKTMADNLVSGEISLGSGDDKSSSNSFSDAVSWTQLSSEEELKEALANNEYYGGIMIPANFTSQQMNSAVGLSNAPELTVYLNKGKNPQMATSMQTALAAAMLKKGVAVNVEMVNDADIGNGMMSETMAVQMLVMPLFMLSMIGSIIASLVFWHKDATELRKKNVWFAAVAQAAFVLVLSAIMAGLALFIDAVAGGLSLPGGRIYPFIWFACFCCMLCFVSLCDACFPLGPAGTHWQRRAYHHLLRSHARQHRPAAPGGLRRRRRPCSSCRHAFAEAQRSRQATFRDEPLIEQTEYYPKGTDYDCNTSPDAPCGNLFSCLLPRIVWLRIPHRLQQRVEQRQKRHFCNNHPRTANRRAAAGFHNSPRFNLRKGRNREGNHHAFRRI